NVGVLTRSSSTFTRLGEGSASVRPRIWRRIHSAFPRDVAQPGSAPALGAGGRWFESSRPDEVECQYLCGKWWHRDRRGSRAEPSGPPLRSTASAPKSRLPC